MNGHIDRLCTDHLNLLRCDIKSQKHRKELIHRPEIAVTHKANRFLKKGLKIKTCDWVIRYALLNHSPHDTLSVCEGNTNI